MRRCPALLRVPSAGSGGGVRTRIRVVVGGLLAALLLLVVLPVAAAGAAAASIVLRQGSRGSAVVVLQRDLHIPADGDFGPQTRRAVITFQRRHHLSADGVVGARTWAALGGAPRVSAPVRTVGVRRPAPPYAHGQPVGGDTGGLPGRGAARASPIAGRRPVPSAFDCSGLVQYVYKRLGVALPRTTYAQYAAAVHVPRSQMRPGDLIFVDRLGHVGIYAGFGFIWHAPHTGDRVRLSLIWDRHYLRGTRPLGRELTPAGGRPPRRCCRRGHARTRRSSPGGTRATPGVRAAPRRRDPVAAAKNASTPARSPAANARCDSRKPSPVSCGLIQKSGFRRRRRSRSPRRNPSARWPPSVASTAS